MIVLPDRLGDTTVVIVWNLTGNPGYQALPWGLWIEEKQNRHNSTGESKALIMESIAEQNVEKHIANIRSCHTHTSEYCPDADCHPKIRIRITIRNNDSHLNSSIRICMAFFHNLTGIHNSGFISVVVMRGRS